MLRRALRLAAPKRVVPTKKGSGHSSGNKGGNNKRSGSAASAVGDAIGAKKGRTFGNTSAASAVGGTGRPQQKQDTPAPRSSAATPSAARSTSAPKASTPAPSGPKTVPLDPAVVSHLEALLKANSTDPLHLKDQAEYLASCHAELDVLAPLALPMLRGEKTEAQASKQPQRIRYGKDGKPMESTARPRYDERVAAAKNDKPATATLSELVALTAFRPNAQGGRLPLRSLATDSLARSKPDAASAAAQRIHFLANSAFSTAFSMRSMTSAANRSQSIAELIAALPAESALVKELLSGAIGTSAAEVEERFEQFATARLQPGYTWLVWNPKAVSRNQPAPVGGDQPPQPPVLGRLELFNPPGVLSPTQFGMWPILCLNMTDRCVVTRPSDSENRFVEGKLQAAARGAAPAWSRAARNPAIAEARALVASLEDPLRHVKVPLTVQKLACAKYQLARFDLEFASTQLEAAKAYYSSESRKKAVASFEESVRAAAVKEAVRKFKTVDHNTLQDVAAETEATAAAASTPEEAPVEGSTPTQEAATEAAPAEQDSGYSVLESGSSKTAEGDDYTFEIRSDGSEWYRYADGTELLQKQDGSKVTTFPSGDVTTDYPDDTRVCVYADGTRLTVNPDGTQIMVSPDGIEQEVTPE